MDKVIKALTGFTAAPGAGPNVKYDAAAKTYAATVTRLAEDVREAIILNPAQALQVLDPAVNSIGYLAVLDILLNALRPLPAIDRTVLLDSTLQFLLKFDPIQIRYVGALFRNLLAEIGSCTLFSPLVSVELLANAILRLDPSGSMFTSTHLIMAKLAYDANCIEPALKVIDSDIIFYPPRRPAETKRLSDGDLEPLAYISTATGLTDEVRSTSILEYHLLRGLIYISRRDWQKAQTALEQVIAHPTKERGVSKIMTESHKKWVLVGLLNEGKEPFLPSYVTGTASQTFGTLSSAYYNIASLFVKENASKFKTEIEKDRQTWEDDGNTTLMAEVVTAYQKWQIINLRQVFHQVSISQIRKTTLSAETAEVLNDDEEVLALVSDMIESGMLKGQLKVGPTSEESYVTFHEDYELMTEAEFAMEIARSHQNIEALSKQYRLTNERLSASKDYARHLVREQKRLEKDGADAGVGFDANIEEEDLMTGVTSHT